MRQRRIPRLRRMRQVDLFPGTGVAEPLFGLAGDGAAADDVWPEEVDESCRDCVSDSSALPPKTPFLFGPLFQRLPAGRMDKEE